MKKIEIISQMTYIGNHEKLYNYKFCSVMNGKLYHPTCDGGSRYTAREFETFFMSSYCNKFKLEFIYD